MLITRSTHARHSLRPSLQTCGWLDVRWGVPRGGWRRVGRGRGWHRSSAAGAASSLRTLLRRFLLLHPGKLVGQRSDRGGRGRGLARRTGLLRDTVVRLVAICGRGSSALLIPSSCCRLDGCARAQAGDGVLEGRRNYCRLLDWWSLKWLQDGGEGRQALC